MYDEYLYDILLKKKKRRVDSLIELNHRTLIPNPLLILKNRVTLKLMIKSQSISYFFNKKFPTNSVLINPDQQSKDLFGGNT